jgi:O-methyltransferase
VLYIFKQSLRKAFKLIGYNIAKTQTEVSDECAWSHKLIEQDFLGIHKKCSPYTITSIEKMYSLYKAAEYVVKHNIPGDMVECGVYKGGSAMLMAHTLMKMGEFKKNIYLYDTYAGMAKPADKDMDFTGRPAIKDYVKFYNKDSCLWVNCPLEEVKQNMFSTGYAKENLVFVKGKVEDTIPGKIPDKICLLSLDTDWFESTYHELYYLFPRLSVNGVIIIDDYGHYRGAREAVDKYFQEKNVKILLNRIDYSARVGIKVDN